MCTLHAVYVYNPDKNELCMYYGVRQSRFRKLFNWFVVQKLYFLYTFSYKSLADLDFTWETNTDGHWNLN